MTRARAWRLFVFDVISLLIMLGWTLIGRQIESLLWGILWSHWRRELRERIGYPLPWSLEGAPHVAPICVACGCSYVHSPHDDGRCLRCAYLP